MNNYEQFEEGFLKEAELHGCDQPFLRGYIKEADEIVEIWKNAFDELAEKSGDPLYHYKLAQELCYLSMIKPELQKRAVDWAGVPEQFQHFLGGMDQGGMGQAQQRLQQFMQQHAGAGQGMGGNLMKWLAGQLQQNPHLLSSLVAGGGGGGLLGLLLGAAVKHPMMGLMLGGLGGAGMSAWLGNQNMQGAAHAHPLVDGPPNQGEPSVRLNGESVPTSSMASTKPMTPSLPTTASTAMPGPATQASIGTAKPATPTKLSA